MIIKLFVDGMGGSEFDAAGSGRRVVPYISDILACATRKVIN